MAGLSHTIDMSSRATLKSAGADLGATSTMRPSIKPSGATPVLKRSGIPVPDSSLRISLGGGLAVVVRVLVYRVEMAANRPLLQA